MGTITARKRKDGTVGYLAQIVIKRKSKVVHREAMTFDRRQAAHAWLKRRETELAEPGALDHRDDPPLHVVIDRYVAESTRIGKTKSQVLNTIKNDFAIGDMECSAIDSAVLVDFAKSILAQPQTRQNYLSHSVCRGAAGVAISARSGRNEGRHGGAQEVGPNRQKQRANPTAYA
jgi:hypothetical protein